jgi:hypothetical protein
MSVEWAELKAAELRALAAAGTVVVVPVAATEQHGPHLPVRTDSLLCSTVAGRGAERAAAQAGGARPAIVTPTVWSGLSEHHMPFGGTLSLDFAAFEGLIGGVCRALQRHGFGRILPPSHLVSPPMRRTLQLAAVGTAAGAFSGLFGVGGGTVIVPLLIIWLAYGEREATGTSMAAIIVVAAYAVALQAGGYGNVDVGNAALVGVPAIGGAVLGTAIQQRVSQRAISGLFALLLVVIAVELIVK